MRRSARPARSSWARSTFGQLGPRHGCAPAAAWNSDALERHLADAAVLDRFARRGILRHDEPITRHLGRQAGFGELPHRVARAQAAHVGHGASRRLDEHVDDRRFLGRTLGLDDFLIVVARHEHGRRRIDRRRHTEIAERGLGDAPEDRAGDRTAKMASRPRGESSITRIVTFGSRDGQEADKRRVRAVRVAAVHQRVRRAGLSGDGVTRDFCEALRRASLDDLLHDAGQRGGRVRADRPAQHLRLDLDTGDCRDTPRERRAVRRTAPPLATELTAAAICSGVTPTW